MKKILSKAYLSSAYAASAQFFEDVASCGEKISAAHLLEMYKIWQMWHLRLSYRAEGFSRSQEELERRQNRQLQFVFLDQEFLPRLIGLVKERKSEFLDYAGQLLRQQDDFAQESLYLQGIIRFWSNPDDEIKALSYQTEAYIQGWIKRLKIA